MTKPGLLHGLVTVEEAAASAIKHVTDGIDDEEAMNRAPDLLAALAAAGWDVVPVVDGYALNEAGFFIVPAERLKELERCETQAMLAARPR